MFKHLIKVNQVGLTIKGLLFYLPKELHSRLKLASLQKEMEMSDIAEDAIAEWLNKHSDV